MPTANRRAFVPQAIHYFLRQSYPHKELLVVDDGDDAVGDLMPHDERIRYFHLPQRQTVGEKRNFACAQARGEIIAHWDDDDWHAPHRLDYQVAALLAGAELCGIQTLLFYDPRQDAAWQYIYPTQGHLSAWLGGSSLCYQRSLWLKQGFPHQDVGEDTLFVQQHQAAQWQPLPDHTFHVGIIHERNIYPKQTNGSYWHPYPSTQIHHLLGHDEAFYQALRNGHTVTARAQTPGNAEALPSTAPLAPMAVARQSDLNLPEFRAFNRNEALPRMRQWEMPFVLFQARLGDTMAVLDCTINPADMAQKLAQLYPHVLYRHWNPLPNQQFALPEGLPDEAFDRVFCLNTLEHLLTAQRAALLADLARKLKPGGELLLTCDFYFDSFWERPATLQAGSAANLLRADRQEVIGGFNQVTPEALVALCRQHNLEPALASWAAPREDEPALFRQLEPYPHACIGGVFRKAPAATVAPVRKVALALLTWNMRDISLDSLRAYLAEACMLQRLGHASQLIICDNGSTDGTAAALRALTQQHEIPCELILNPENRGNSIARNQIIDAALVAEADYLLFMDGDIEIVPFSSFAMLRYMETQGGRLGCIGADASWQTPQRAQASDALYAIEPANVRATNLVAWTQYGLFRCEMFRKGIRFDETAPLGEPGWGFEDNDLAFQMDVAGYRNHYFHGMVYLHRNLHSSLGLLRQSGLDPIALFQRRRQYLLDKWDAVAQIKLGPLADVQRAIMPR